MTRTVGTPVEAAPSAAETTPSIPFAPRLASGRIALGPAGSHASMSRTGIELPAHTIPPSGRRSATWAKGAPSNGSPAVGGPGQPAAQGAVGGTIGDAASRPASAWPRARYRAEAAAARAPLPGAERIGEGVGGAGGIGMHEGRGQDRRITPAPVAVHDHLGRALLLEQRQHRLRRGHGAEAQDQARDVGGAPRTRSQELVAAGDDAGPVVGAAADERERIGQDRPVEGGGEAADGRGERRVVLGTGQDEAALHGGQAPRQALDVLVDEEAQTGDRRRRLLAVGGSAAGHPAARREGPERAVGHQRLAERDVEVDGPGRAGDRRRHRPGSDRADVARRHGLTVEERQLGEPLRMGPEEVHLVDGLGGPPVAQLGRPVRGQEDQGHPAERRLDDRGQEIGRGGARGREDGHGPARCLRHAQGEEARASLVEQHTDGDARVGAQGEGERRGA